VQEDSNKKLFAQINGRLDLLNSMKRTLGYWTNIWLLWSCLFRGYWITFQQVCMKEWFI